MHYFTTLLAITSIVVPSVSISTPQNSIHNHAEQASMRVANISASKLLADLSRFSVSAFDVDYMSLDMDLHQDKETLLKLVSALSDQVDDLDAATEYTKDTKPFKGDEDEILQLQDKILNWEQQIEWEAQDLGLFVPKAARKLDQTAMMSFFIRRMKVSFEEYSAIVLGLVPDDSHFNLRHGKKKAVVAITRLTDRFKSAEESREYDL